MDNLNWAAKQTVKLMRNKDQLALADHKRWVSSNGVEFRRLHDIAVKHLQPYKGI